MLNPNAIHQGCHAARDAASIAFRNVSGSRVALRARNDNVLVCIFLVFNPIVSLPRRVHESGYERQNSCGAGTCVCLKINYSLQAVQKQSDARRVKS
jgi:hypothetical protein